MDQAFILNKAIKDYDNQVGIIKKALRKHIFDYNFTTGAFIYLGCSHLVFHYSDTNFNIYCLGIMAILYFFKIRGCLQYINEINNWYRLVSNFTNNTEQIKLEADNETTYVLDQMCNNMNDSAMKKVEEITNMFTPKVAEWSTLSKLRTTYSLIKRACKVWSNNLNAARVLVYFPLIFTEILPSIYLPMVIYQWYFSKPYSIFNLVNVYSWSSGMGLWFFHKIRNENIEDHSKVFDDCLDKIRPYLDKLLK